jgi:hypothetical protein
VAASRILNAAAVQRYARQIALPEIGPEGQERLAAACVVVAGGDSAAEVAAHYLAAAGIGALRLVGGNTAWDVDLRGSQPDITLDHRLWPADGAEWMAALAKAHAIVRSGFDDDSMMRAALRHGLPAVIVRGREDGIELIAFRRQGPCPHAPLDVPFHRSVPPQDGAPAVVAGTLAAAEALHVLLGSGGEARARHMSLPLDGRAPRTQDIPWSPECFACGGNGTEMSFS